MRKRIDDEIAEVMAILDRPDPKATQRSAEAALNMALAQGDGPLRRKYLAKAQKYIAQMDPEREVEAIQELQGHILTLQGRGGDTRIAHVTPGEIVIPKSMQTPEMMAALARAARQAGLDPRRFRVGQGRVNPRTGREEFFDPTSPEDPPYDGPIPLPPDQQPKQDLTPQLIPVPNFDDRPEAIPNLNQPICPPNGSGMIRDAEKQIENQTSAMERNQSIRDNVLGRGSAQGSQYDAAVKQNAQAIERLTAERARLLNLCPRIKI